jgi:hypothetical protein
MPMKYTQKGIERVPQRESRPRNMARKARVGMSEHGGVVEILTRIQTMYPEGIIPQTDFPALVAILRTWLANDDVVRVTTELTVWGPGPATGVDLRNTSPMPTGSVASDHISRVSDRLRITEWPTPNNTSA